VTHAVVGGLASVAGGGKFENGAVTAAFGYLFSQMTRPQELRAGEYARTYVDFWGNVQVEYLGPYKDLDSISQEAVRVHEGVHVQQLEALTVRGCPWGCFAMYRATWDGINALELPAFKAELNFLNGALDAVPRSEWTADHRSADLRRWQVQQNLWRAEQYQREGRKF
jgi:hypothetical protein